MFEFHGTGLPEAIREWVKKHPKVTGADRTFLDRIVAEELEALTANTSDVISMWDALDRPTHSTGGRMGEFENIVEAMKVEVYNTFTEKAWVWCYLQMCNLRMFKVLEGQ